MNTKECFIVSGNRGHTNSTNVSLFLKTERKMTKKQLAMKKSKPKYNISAMDGISRIFFILTLPAVHSQMHLKQ